MKKVTIKKEVEETKWETVDGYKFDSEDRARDWEYNLRCVALKRIGDRIKNIKNEEDYWKVAWMAGIDNDSYLRIFTPENEEDIKNFIMYTELSGKYWLKYCTDMKSEMKPGNKYLIIEDSENDCISVFSDKSFKDFIKERTEIFNKMMKL